MTAHEEIKVLRESDPQTLCVQLTGVVSKQAFNEGFYKPFLQRAGNGQSYNLLVHYDPDFKGWSKEAAEASFQSIIDYGQQARKLAYVNPPDSKLLQVKMARSLFGGEIKFFEEDELNEAVKWVKA